MSTPKPEPDAYCVTTPDGGCISIDPRCMHQPDYGVRVPTNMPPDERNLFNKVLGQQLAVLMRIDNDSDVLVPSRGIFFRQADTHALDQRRLKALEMGKRMAEGCTALWRYLNPQGAFTFGAITREELRQVLTKILETDFDHPYQGSAKWNFQEIVGHLDKDITHEND